MATYQMFLEKFSETGQPILGKAIELTKESGQRHLCEAHLVVAFSMVQPEMFGAAIREGNYSAEKVIADAEKTVAELPANRKKEGISIHQSATDCFKRAIETARRTGRNEIDSTDLLQAINFDAPSRASETKDEVAPSLVMAFRSLWNVFK